MTSSPKSPDAAFALRRILPLVTLLAATIAAGDQPGRLENVRVEPAGPVAGKITRRLVDRQGGDVPLDDPIERELRLQRAIARSLRGDAEQAIAILDQAGAADTASSYAAAMWLLEQGEITAGVERLESIASRSDAPEETQKFLAIGYLHLEQLAASERAVEAFLAEHPDDQYAHYLHGLVNLRQNRVETATESLRLAGYDDRETATIRQVAMQVPVDVQQRLGPIDNTLADTRGFNLGRGTGNRAGGPADDRFYNFTFLIAGEYDSNVPLQPQFSGLGSDQIDYEDYRFLMAAFLDLQLLTCETFNLGMVGSTFNTFQFDSNDFDIQDYMGGGYTNGLIGEDLIGSLRYEYHHTLVAKRRFASEHRLTPSLTWLGSRGHTTTYYEYNPIDADAPALIPAQFQSADIHRLGLTQAIYTAGGDGRVYVGYQFATALADGSDFDRNTNMVTGRIEQPLCYGWIGDLDVRYVWDDYDNANSLDFFGRARQDDRLELRTGLQKNFLAPVSLRLDYTYINNDSNTENLFGVRFYDYDRHIFSTQLIFTL